MELCSSLLYVIRSLLGSCATKNEFRGLRCHGAWNTVVGSSLLLDSMTSFTPNLGLWWSHPLGSSSVAYGHTELLHCMEEAQLKREESQGTDSTQKYTVGWGGPPLCTLPTPPHLGVPSRHLTISSSRRIYGKYILWAFHVQKSLLPSLEKLFRKKTQWTSSQDSSTGKHSSPPHTTTSKLQLKKEL